MTRANIPIDSDADIVRARQEGRMIAEKIGFRSSDLAVIATAISEVARNIVEYGVRGEILINRIDDGSTRIGIEVVARDDGPGIRDLERALQDGYSTGKGLGLGLPGCRRLMDEFTVRCGGDTSGTTVWMRKWLVER